jgi:HJR/Mrr/RecB family endonuclease
MGYVFFKGEVGDCMSQLIKTKPELFYVFETNIPTLALTEEYYDVSDFARLCALQITTSHFVISPKSDKSVIKIAIRKEVDSLTISEEKGNIFTIKIVTPENQDYYLKIHDLDITSELLEFIACVKAYELFQQAEYLYAKNPIELHNLLDQYLKKTKNQVFNERSDIDAFDYFVHDILNADNKHVSCYDDLNKELLFWYDDEYFDTFFIKLVKLLKRKLDVREDVDMIVMTWFLLKKVAVHHFHTWIIENTSIRPGNDLQFYKEELRNLHMVLYSAEQLEMRMMYFLIKEGVVSENDFFERIDHIETATMSIDTAEAELDGFEQFLLSTVEDLPVPEDVVTMEAIDQMSGVEFENFLEKLFLSLGYRVAKTKQTGDQGVDLILTKGDQTIGVQSKRSAGSIGNKAVQEISAGLRHYGLKRGMVVTNNSFTPSAYDLAKSNGIVLWERAQLKQQLELFNI